MKLILKVFGFALLMAILIPLIIALFVRKDYVAEKQIEVNKPIEEVFSYLVMLKNQDDYSVWSRQDPDMKHEYTGVDGTVGFISAWASETMGSGAQEIKVIVPNERIDYELRFIKPFKSTSEVYLTTEALDEGKTLVRWGMKGHMPYPTNLLLLFMNLEKGIGSDFEKGLENMKQILEQ